MWRRNLASLQCDAAHLPLPDESVDLIVTSPPYFALRTYLDGGEAVKGQVGNEPTPQQFLESLWECTREWMRVLKPRGSIFVNLGDKYAGGGGNWEQNPSPVSPACPNLGGSTWGFRAKSLMNLPARYAIGCTDQLGLIQRAEIVWCLSGGARVYARIGGRDRPVMLRDLARSYRPQDVQLWNGERWTQVLGWNLSPDSDDALELELRTGERIGCTPGHRWPTQRGIIRADEIRTGDVITTTGLPEPDELAQPAALDEDDIGWFVGMYLAEGSLSERILQFSGHVRETARHERLRRIATAYHGRSSVYQTSENGSTFNINGAVLLAIIDHYVGLGRTSKTKRLRQSAWQRGNRFLAAVVSGYLEGDGHYDAKNDRWRLGFTENDEWASDMRTLAARLSAKISLRRHRFTFDNREFPGWRGEWRWSSSDHWSVKQPGEVVAIRQSRARQFFDVGVADEPHLFALASGVLTHNSKPNGLPESVKDRVRRSHELLFHFTKQGDYYQAVDRIREQHKDPKGKTWEERKARGASMRAGDNAGSYSQDSAYGQMAGHSLGKLPSSVWEIPTAPLVVPKWLKEEMESLWYDIEPDEVFDVDHFAAFPPALVQKIIDGWSPAQVCTKCGNGRFPVSLSEYRQTQASGDMEHGRLRPYEMPHGRADKISRIVGSACACTPYEDHPENRGKDWRGGVEQDRKVSGQRMGKEFQGNGRTGDSPHMGGRWGSSEEFAKNQWGRAPVREYLLDQWDPAPTEPGVVLDPFGGTGTTAIVAAIMGRRGISGDLSFDYAGRMVPWRANDRSQMKSLLGRKS